MHRYTGIGVLAIAFAGALCSSFAVLADDSAGYVRLKPTAADRAAASAARLVHRRAYGVRAEQPGASVDRFSPAQAAAASRTKDGDGNDGSGTRNPGDLHYFGGATVRSAQSHAIYLLPNGSCPVATCWGNPEQFLKDLGRSNFIHVLDQYTFATDDRRYGVGQGYTASFTAPMDFTTTPFTDSDMQLYVYLAAKQGGTGYGHIYHVFLPPGADECFDSFLNVCYSPDNLSAFAFCAYHNSVDFPDIGHVLYSVEPYQNTRGCWDEPGTPNGRQADSTNDTLSHELFETISDPDGDGWWQWFGLGMFGQEIGDECVFLAHDGQGSGVPVVYSAHDHTYATQPEYNNNRHACTDTP